jgi:hypothetical protein
MYIIADRRYDENDFSWIISRKIFQYFESDILIYKNISTPFYDYIS